MEKTNERKKNYCALLDVNGVLLMPKEGEECHMVDRPVTPSFLKKLKETLLTPSPMTDLDHFRQALAGIECPDLTTKTSLEEDLSRWSLLASADHQQCHLSTNPSLGEGSNRFGRWILEKQNDQYFNRYALDHEELNNIPDLFQVADITLLSGIPHTAGQRLANELKPVWPYLRSDAAAVLSPNKNVSGIHLKLAAVGIFGQIRDRSILYLEDDYLVAKWVAAFYNIQVYMKPNELAAIRQPHYSSGLPQPKPQNTNGNIIFGATIERMLADANNLSFTNQPSLDYVI